MNVLSTGSVTVTLEHAVSSVADVKAALGPGRLEFERGSGDSDGLQRESSIWTGGPGQGELNALGSDAAEWLAAHEEQLSRLKTDGWNILLELGIIAREPVTSVSLPRGLLQAVAAREISMEIVIFPKPVLVSL